MNWEDRVKQRYQESGPEAFQVAEEAFKKRLQLYTFQQRIHVIDDNPEGQDWMLLLRDGSELYVHRRSYDTGNDETDFWIEYSPDDGGVIAEYLGGDAKRIKRDVVVPNEEITAFTDDWY